MAPLFLNTINKAKKIFFHFLLILLVASVCFGFSIYIDYKIVAFLLLLAVSLIAMFFDILPVLFSACLSALILDYFFIPPHFNFHINKADDGVLLLTYFIIALVNAVLTYKIRQIE